MDEIEYFGHGGISVGEDGENDDSSKVGYIELLPPEAYRYVSPVKRKLNVILTKVGHGVNVFSQKSDDNKGNEREGQYMSRGGSINNINIDNNANNATGNVSLTRYFPQEGEKKSIVSDLNGSSEVNELKQRVRGTAVDVGCQTFIPQKDAYVQVFFETSTSDSIVTYKPLSSSPLNFDIIGNKGGNIKNSADNNTDLTISSVLPSTHFASSATSSFDKYSSVNDKKNITYKNGNINSFNNQSTSLYLPQNTIVSASKVVNTTVINEDITNDIIACNGVSKICTTSSSLPTFIPTSGVESVNDNNKEMQTTSANSFISTSSSLKGNEGGERRNSFGGNIVENNYRTSNSQDCIGNRGRNSNNRVVKGISSSQENIAKVTNVNTNSSIGNISSIGVTSRNNNPFSKVKRLNFFKPYAHQMMNLGDHSGPHSSITINNNTSLSNKFSSNNDNISNSNTSGNNNKNCNGVILSTNSRFLMNNNINFNSNTGNTKVVTLVKKSSSVGEISALTHDIPNDNPDKNNSFDNNSNFNKHKMQKNTQILRGVARGNCSSDVCGGDISNSYINCNDSSRANRTTSEGSSVSSRSFKTGEAGNNAFRPLPSTGSIGSGSGVKRSSRENYPHLNGDNDGRGLGDNDIPNNSYIDNNDIIAGGCGIVINNSCSSKSLSPPGVIPSTEGAVVRTTSASQSKASLAPSTSSSYSATKQLLFPEKTDPNVTKSNIGSLNKSLIGQRRSNTINARPVTDSIIKGYPSSSSTSSSSNLNTFSFGLTAAKKSINTRNFSRDKISVVNKLTSNEGVNLCGNSNINGTKSGNNSNRGTPKARLFSLNLSNYRVNNNNINSSINSGKNGNKKGLVVSSLSSKSPDNANYNNNINKNNGEATIIARRQSKQSSSAITGTVRQTYNNGKVSNGTSATVVCRINNKNNVSANTDNKTTFFRSLSSKNQPKTTSLLSINTLMPNKNVNNTCPTSNSNKNNIDEITNVFSSVED